MRAAQSVYQSKALATFLLLALVGCSAKAEVESSRTPARGTVKFNGQPLLGGSVTLTSASDAQLRVTAMLKTDGTFAVDDAPKGDVIVTVETETLRFGAPADQYVPIPSHYAKPNSSPLKFNISPSGPPLEVALSDK